MEEKLWELWNAEDIADKASWEGSLFNLFEWGLTPDKVVPGKLHDAVTVAYNKFMELQEALTVLDRLLPDVEET